MTKQEFLEKLRLALSGRVSSELLMENMQFYEDYINIEIRKGKTEEEVLNQLGDPRLIARTIVETRGSEKNLQEEREGDKRGHFVPGLLLRLPMWIWLVLFLVIVALIFSAIFSVISMVLPVLLPILLVLFLVKVFRDWFH